MYTHIYIYIVSIYIYIYTLSVSSLLFLQTFLIPIYFTGESRYIILCASRIVGPGVSFTIFAKECKTLGGGGGDPPPRGAFDGMGAKIALWGPKCQGATPFEAFEHPCFLKTASQMALGSILEPPGVEFGGSGVDFCDI